MIRSLALTFSLLISGAAAAEPHEVYAELLGAAHRARAMDDPAEAMGLLSHAAATASN